MASSPITSNSILDHLQLLNPLGKMHCDNPTIIKVGYYFHVLVYIKLYSNLCTS